MKTVYTALIFSMMVSPVLAEAPGKPARQFPDAPPPPQVAPSAVAACCTDAGGRALVNPVSKDSLPIEGAACEAKSADGLSLAGTICY